MQGAASDGHVCCELVPSRTWLSIGGGGVIGVPSAGVNGGGNEWVASESSAARPEREATFQDLSCQRGLWHLMTVAYPSQ